MQRQARVTNLLPGWSGVQALQVEIEAAPPNASQFLPGQLLKALAYPQLVGPISVNQQLRIDCSALAKDLGTGGYATVLATAELPPDALPATGHIVKARYLPHQPVVLGAEEPDSPIRAEVSAVDKLDHLPVVVADLHSALPAIIAGIRSVNSTAKIVYIHDDSASLPVAWSRTVSELHRHKWITATISAGQSFGGTWEAASVPSALSVAKAIKADCAIITPGPGNLGTSTRWGFSSVSSAANLHYAHALGGHPIAAVRASQADRRAAHRGISHHSLTVLRDLLLVKVTVALPNLGPDGICAQTRQRFNWGRSQLKCHHLELVAVERCNQALSGCPVELKTMGRSYPDDPLAFQVAAAAGIIAGEQLSE